MTKAQIPPPQPRARALIKDDAIRSRASEEILKKAEKLSCVQNTSWIKSNRQQFSGTGSTVASLKPSIPYTITKNSRVVEAALVMAASRTDALLVLDDFNEICGIVTDKDIAYRAVATNQDCGTILVSSIMTRNLTVAYTNQNASDALDLMVKGGFRHLPLIEQESGDVVGILDITKCLFHALCRMDKLFGSSKKVSDALDAAERELGETAKGLILHFETVRQKLLVPTVESLLIKSKELEEFSDFDDDKTTVSLNEKPYNLSEFVSLPSQNTTVYESAIAMRDSNSTAVILHSPLNGKLQGIFTTKDLVLRVIAQKLDPKITSLSRVMTPNPDSIQPKTSVHHALRLMHTKNYMHLPIANKDGNPIGLVDVLRLSYSVLEKINSLKEGDLWSSSMAPLSTEEDNISEIMFNSIDPSDSASINNKQSQQNSVMSKRINEDFIFKFKDFKNVQHKIILNSLTILSLRNSIKNKINEELFNIFYIDEDKDFIFLNNDDDLLIAAKNSNSILLKIEKIEEESLLRKRKVIKNNEITKYIGLSIIIIIVFVGIKYLKIKQ